MASTADSGGPDRTGDDPIGWHVELALSPGGLEAFRILSEEMTEVTRSEPGAIVYERFVSDDGSTAWVLERYANSDAALQHLEEFARRFGRRFSALVERRRFVVLGTPSRALRALLDGYGAIYNRRVAGFARPSEAGSPGDRQL